MADIVATIEQYSDFFSEWYGLKNGTILSVDDENGRMWRKFGSDNPIDVTRLYVSSEDENANSQR